MLNLVADCCKLLKFNQIEPGRGTGSFFYCILWVKFWNNESSFCVCVCYLPPDGSTRLNDAEQFYTRLTEQVYQYQNLGNVFICGDFNSRCGEASDYVEGVDDVRERDVIDVTSNHYGDLLLNFPVGPQTFDFACFHYFSEHTAALKIIP